MTLLSHSPNSMALLFLLSILLVSSITTIATASASADASSSSSSTNTPLLPAIDLGTTLVAIAFDRGVVVGADTRTSVGGAYVSHRSTPNKIVMLDKHLVLARSGSAATTQHLAQAARRHILTRMYSSSGCGSTRPNKAALTVPQMAHWLQNRVYELPGGSEAVASLLVAGCDLECFDDIDPNQNVRPGIYVILPSGACWPEERFAVAGSGSSYVLGFLDHHLQPSVHTSIIKQDEAVLLCRQALSLAMARDGSSGGLCRIFVVTAQGCTEMSLSPVVAFANGGKNENRGSATAAGDLKGFAPAAATANTPP